MKLQRHLFRDVFLLTLPVLGLLGYVLAVSFANFYNAEIRNFHGRPVGPLRVGGMKSMLASGIDPLLDPASRRYLPDWLRMNVAAREASGSEIPVFDLRVRGGVLDELAADLPQSGEQWHSAELIETGTEDGFQVSRRRQPEGDQASRPREPVGMASQAAAPGSLRVPSAVPPSRIRKVQVRFRGQQMSRYFWERKAWKIKTKKRELLYGYRKINLTPIDRPRLCGHLTFLIAERVGLMAPQSRVVRLYLNREDQGLYVQEEQIDESMIRRNGRMPGDIFYGELYPPDEPKLSGDDLFWNPYLWRKKDGNNKYPEEHRPYLAELLDHVCDESPASFGRLYDLCDMQRLALHFAVLTFQGDMHIDHRHNHKLYFDPLSGKFEPIIWNPLFNMSGEEAVESMNNRFYRKLCRDPRFLDRVHRLLYEELVLGGMTGRQLRELDRIKTEYGAYALDREHFDQNIETTRADLRQRDKSVRQFLDEAAVNFQDEPAFQGEAAPQHPGFSSSRGATEGSPANGNSRAAETESEVSTPAAGVRRLNVWARSAASLRLKEIVLEGSAGGVRLWEDRDFDGTITPGDRELPVSGYGKRLSIDSDAALLYPGRDLRGLTPNQQSTRLAFLQSRYLLAAQAGRRPPAAADLVVERTVGTGEVAVRRGRPEGYVSAETETVHPWTIPAPEPPRAYRYSGEVELREDLVVRAQDSFEAEPGTTFRLGPGVSLVFHGKVRLKDIQVRRLDPKRPWGVIALQGAGASGSVLQNCDLSGGSNDTIHYVDYYGMLSVHYADGVVVSNCRLSDNVLGDDTIRFAGCDDLRVEYSEIQRANGDGIDCDLSSGRILASSVTNPRNDGIDLMTSRVEISRSEIAGAGDKGISFGEGADATVVGCTIRDCVLGLGIKDGSDPTVERTVLRNCRTAVSGYDKNWRYPGGGRGRLVDCALQGNQLDVKLDDRSRLVLEGCGTVGRVELPADAAAGALQVLPAPKTESRP